MIGRDNLWLAVIGLAFGIGMKCLSGFRGDRRANAEDIAQETAIVVMEWARRQNPEPDDKTVLKFTGGVVRNKILEFFRTHRSAFSFLPEHDTRIAPQSSPGKVLQAIDLAVTSPIGRALLRQHILDTSSKRQPVSEYARRLYIPKSTACREWNAALDELADWLRGNSLDG